MCTDLNDRELAARLKQAESAGLDSFLDSLLDEALRSMHVAEGTLALLNQKESTLEIVKRRSRFPEDLRKKYRRFKVGEGIAGWVAEHATAAYVPDVQADPRFKPPVDKLLFRSMIAVPIIRESRAVGVICVDTPDPERLRPEGVDALSRMAYSVGPAIVDLAVDTYISHTRRLKQLDSLQDVGQLLSRALQSPHELDEILERIAQEAWRVLDADLITLYQYDARTSSFITPPKKAGPFRHGEWMFAKVSPSDAPARVVAAGKSLYSEVALNDRIMRAAEVVRAGDGLPERPSFVDREGVESSAGILLKAADEVVGVMFVNYRNHHPFPEDERHVIEIFAAYAALAIRGSRRVNEIIKLRQQEALMRSSGMFVHRLRNTVAPVSEYLRILCRTPGLSQHAMELCRKAADENSHAQSIVKQFEMFAKGEVFECPDKIRPDDLARRMAEVVRQALADKSGSVEVYTDKSAPMVQINFERLRDDFVAFAKDSERHRPQGLEIVITTTTASDSEIARYGLQIKKRHLKLIYQDNGPGIPEPLKQKIFEPYFTTTGGSGLGLHIARYNAGIHGGRLFETGDPHDGARFEMFLPEAVEVAGSVAA